MPYTANELAAIRNSDSYNKGVKVSFRKILKEFNTSVNVLMKYFKKEGNMVFKDQVTFVKKVTSQSSSAADIMGIMLKTPAPKVPTYRRRTNNIEEEVIHIVNPRAHAKTLGISVENLVELETSLARDALARGGINIILKLLQGTYKEDTLTRVVDQTRQGFPNIAEFDELNGINTTSNPFSNNFRHLIKGPENTIGNTQGFVQTTGKLFKAPPLAEGFFYLTAALANFKQVSMTNPGMNQGTGSPTKARCLAILNNTGWAVWKESNLPKIGNRDYFGKDVVLGMGKIFSFQEYDFLVLPDDLFPNATGLATSAIDNDDKFNAAVTFPDPEAWDNYSIRLLNATKSAANNNQRASFANSVGMYRMLIVDPMAFRLMEPKQLQVPLRQYEDKDYSFEKLTFGKMSMEGTRIWDDLVREIYFTGEGFTGSYA